MPIYTGKGKHAFLRLRDPQVLMFTQPRANRGLLYLTPQDEALAEEVIANHFLLGEEIKLAELKRDQKRRTAGGQQLVFKVDKNGAWNLK